MADCKLGEQPNQVLQKPISEGYSPITDATKNDVLMVMMENYEGKKQKFLPTGKLAVGIKYTRDGIDTSYEMDSSEIHSSRKAYTPNTRYDAQYFKLSQLKSTK